MSRIRLIAADIDGTLLNSKFEVSPDDLAALRRAHDSGIEIILVTGRRHTFARPIAERLGFFDHLWLISSNGAVTRSFAGEEFHRDVLPASTARAMVQAMSDYRGNIVITFEKEAKGALVMESLDELQGSIRRWLESNMAYIEFVRPVEDSIVSDPIQAMLCGSVARMESALAVLNASPILDRIHVLRTVYPHRDLSIVDILNQGCSKGHALKRWAEHRGIAREAIMAIGDNYNDLEMLEFAGNPVIMGNAADDLKRPGWHVTRSHDESGLAAAIQTVCGI